MNINTANPSLVSNKAQEIGQAGMDLEQTGPGEDLPETKEHSGLQAEVNPMLRILRPVSSCCHFLMI